jgi:hypothetical protein
MIRVYDLTPEDARAEIERLERVSAQEINARNAEIDRLREALRPFYGAAIRYDSAIYGDGESYWLIGNSLSPEMSVTVADLRRARAALEPKS